MSSIKVKETRASRLRAGKTYGTPRQSTSQPTRSIIAPSSTSSSNLSTTSKKWLCGGCKKTVAKGKSVHTGDNSTRGSVQFYARLSLQWRVAATSLFILLIKNRV